MARCSRNRSSNTTASREPATDLAEEAWARLEKLLIHYADPTTGYLSRALPFREGETDGDYDHLARVLEWSAGGDASDAGRARHEEDLSRPDRDGRAARRSASDPRNSAWVSANAGSGKTHVLSQRVIRLLLRGTDPSKILCLTYTRAAAANMSNRVFSTLSEWTMLRRRGAGDQDRGAGRSPARSRQDAPGAPAVRRGAGNAGRAEDPDHPRLLRIGAAPVSAGSQHRRPISKCSTRRWRRRCSPLRAAT